MDAWVKQRYFRTATDLEIAESPILETERKQRIRGDLWKLAGALGVIAGGYLLYLLGDAIHTAWGDLSTLKEPKDRMEGFRNFFWGVGFIVGGLFGVIFAGWRSWNTHRTTNVETQKIRLETFTKAVEQLGHDSAPIRIGAIQSLEQVSKMDREFYVRAVETLCAFIREHRIPKPDPVRSMVDAMTGAKTVSTASVGPTTVDIQLALTVLGRRDRQWETTGGIIDLRACDLRKADLARGSWSGARLREANLERAHLYLAHLEGASLYSAHLEGALLYGAHLEGANLTFANLNNTKLFGVNLTGIDLTEKQRAQADFERIF